MTEKPYIKTNDLSCEEANALFEYRNGQLFWKVNTKARKAGDLAGCPNNQGYWRVGVKNKQYRIHRVIWVMHGNKPVDVLDHIDGDPSNNRIENLRAANHSTNLFNTKTQARNSHGVKGLRWRSSRKSWIGVVRYREKQFYTASFQDKAECIAALRALRESLHGEYARH
jgi:hypothetical protein